MLFNFSLARNYAAEVLSSGLTLDIHQIILASLPSSLITSFSLTGQISVSYNVRLHTHAEYSLSFASKGKPLLANKDTNFLNLLHQLLLLFVTLWVAPPQAPIMSLI